MLKSDSIDSLLPALIEAQKEFGKATKDTTGYGYKYANLETVVEVSRPALEKNGLIVLQPIHFDGEKIVVETILYHKSGQFMGCEVVMPPLPAAKMNDAQAVGSSITYARRYGYSSLLGIVTEDDDANATGAKPNEQAKDKKQAPPPGKPPQESEFITEEQWVYLEKMVGDTRKSEAMKHTLNEAFATLKIGKPAKLSELKRTDAVFILKHVKKTTDPAKKEEVVQTGEPGKVELSLVKDAVEKTEEAPEEAPAAEEAEEEVDTETGEIPYVEKIKETHKVFITKAVGDTWESAPVKKWIAEQLKVLEQEAPADFNDLSEDTAKALCRTARAIKK